METLEQLHNFMNFRKFAEPRMDAAMESVSPGVGWCFDADGTARLLDIEKQRLLLLREPTLEQNKCLAGFRLECALRGDDNFRFAFNGDLYLHADGAPFQRFSWDAAALEWTREDISLAEWREAEDYAGAHAPADIDRAARAREDMARVRSRMEGKPTGKVMED